MNNTRTIYFSKEVDIAVPTFLIGAAVGDEAVVRDLLTRRLLAKSIANAAVIKTNESPEYALKNTKEHTDIILQLQNEIVKIDVKTPSCRDGKILLGAKVSPELFYAVIVKYPNDAEGRLLCVKGEELIPYVVAEQGKLRISQIDFHDCLERCMSKKMNYLNPIPVPIEDYMYVKEIRDIAASNFKRYKKVDTGSFCISTLAEIAKNTRMQELYETRYNCKLQFKASEDII